MHARPLYPLWTALPFLLLLIASPLAAQTVEEPTDEEPPLEEEAPLDEEEMLPYSDGLTYDESGDFYGADAEGTYLWGYRGEDGSWDALAYDILTDNIPPEYALVDWDRPLNGEDGESDTPLTAEEIQAKLADEEYSPLKQVIVDGPVQGQPVPLFVLVPDELVRTSNQTGGIPDAATYKALQRADQLVNGVMLTYSKRGDTITLSSPPQSTVPQLQLEGADFFQGVVKYRFNLGLDPAVMANRMRGEATTGEAYGSTASSISDGFEAALQEALRSAARRAISNWVRSTNSPLPDTVTGTIDYYEIIDEGLIAEENEFFVQVRAYITIKGGPATAMTPATIDPNAYRSSADPSN